MSYLAWPVLYKNKMYHMTLKYFGGTPVNTHQLFERVGDMDASPPECRVWRREKFGKSFHVFELVNYPKRLQLLREAFADIRKDDYPIYRPHITVTKEDWDEGLPSRTIFFPLALMDPFK